MRLLGRQDGLDGGQVRQLEARQLVGHLEILLLQLLLELGAPAEAAIDLVVAELALAAEVHGHQALTPPDERQHETRPRRSRAESRRRRAAAGPSSTDAAASATPPTMRTRARIATGRQSLGSGAFSSKLTATSPDRIARSSRMRPSSSRSRPTVVRRIGRDSFEGCESCSAAISSDTLTAVR